MKILRAPEAALTIALLSACGGGGGTAPPSTTTLANQTSGLSAYPISNNRVVLSPTGGYTGAVTLPSVSSGAGAMVRIGTQTMPPTGVAILSSSARQPASAQNVPLLFVVFTPDRDAVLTAHPGFEITLPQAPLPGAAYYIAALDDNTGQWKLGLEGPGKISGSTLTFTAAPGSVPWGANEPYWYAVYVAATTDIDPTPAPTH